METWALLAVASAVGWAVIVLIDKFVVDSEINSSLGTGGLHALFNCLAVAAISLYLRGFTFSLYLLAAGALLGGLYVLANLFWFSGVGSEDVSRFAPVLSFDAVFIAILSFIFLQETFSAAVYGGIVLTVLGCILISLEDPLKSLSKMKSKWGLVAALSSAFVYSVREVIFKYISSGVEIWSLLFYFGTTGMAFSLILVYMSRDELAGKRSGFEHMTLSGLISGVSQAVFFLAVSIGPVSLVSTITKTRFLIIFIGATAISRLHPEIIHETMDRRVLIQKAIAISMIIAGVGLVSMLG